MQLQLNLTAPIEFPTPHTYIEALCGLTSWILTKDSPPPYIGWWRTYREDGHYARRWWDGGRWSAQVFATDSDLLARYAHCVHPNPKYLGDVRWCGLLRPHIAGYLEYNLVKSPRLQMAELLLLREGV